MWELLLPLLAGGATLWIKARGRSQRLQARAEAAAACGLVAEEPASFLAPALKFKTRDGGLNVRLESGGKGTEVVVAVPGPPWFSDLRIKREGPLGASREIHVGDKEFDDTFAIQGPRHLALSLLNAEVRLAMLQVNAHGPVKIAWGELRADLPDDKLRQILPIVLDIGRRLAGSLDVEERLAENARRDPEEGVRLRNLLLLVFELPAKKPVVDAALRAACADPSPRIRIRAAKELGSEGHGVLRELAAGLEDDAISAQAVTALGAELAFEQTADVLRNALRRRRLRTALACLESAGRGGAPAVEILAKVVAREHGELAAAAARALGQTASAAAEPPLVLALQHEDPQIRVAAANALGEIGAAAAVLPLKEAAARHANDAELRRATRQAIAAIQSRLTGASPGQLSLAGDEAGRLSLAEAEAGQLSLADDPAGQLSLSAEPRQRDAEGGRA